MRLTVLGSAASHAGEGQACAGYLVEGGGSRIMLDCGNGAVANLYRVADPLTLDAVFVTHNHPDHYVDLYSLQAMLRYAPSGPIEGLRLYMPEDLFPRMQLLLSERGGAEFREAFAFTPLRGGEPVLVGGMRVTPREVEHTDPTFALVVEADGTSLCYTADTAPGDNVVEAARGCGLLLAEATLPEQFAGAAPHLSATQAGQIAQAAGVSSLVLTHIWPTNDRREAMAMASTAFAGTVHVATEFDTYDVP